MRKFVVILAVLFASVICKAQQRSDAEMDSIALSVLERNVQLAKAKGTNKWQITFDKERLENLTVLSNGTGAVMVTNNKDAVPVLGYTFDYHAEKELPCGYKWWLEAVNKSLSLESIKGNRKRIIRPPANYPSKVDPILESHWTQLSPYNELCPNKYYAGCGAICLAQIMYAHKHPEHGTGYYAYNWNNTLLSANFEDTYYDWDNMLPSYDIVSYTNEQAYAVAELVYHCGIAQSIFAAVSTAFFKNVLVSHSMGVPSGYVIPQYILTTAPCSGRQGRSARVSVSGCRNRSEFISSPKPDIEEASIAIPCSNARSSSLGMMAIFFCTPNASQNDKRINLTSSSFTYSSISSGELSARRTMHWSA